MKVRNEPAIHGVAAKAGKDLPSSKETRIIKGGSRSWTAPAHATRPISNNGAL